MLKPSHCLLPLAMICGLSVHAADLYVAPSANDSNPGTQAAPFKNLSAARNAARKMAGREAVKVTVTDGVIIEGYGPVFANGIHLGIYKMDLGTSQPVATISSWSFNQNRTRGRQIVTIYGINSPGDPGWKVKDAGKFTPLGSLDTASLPSAPFTAASLRAPSGSSLGTYRWIAWQTSSLADDSAENTAWQEFSVGVKR